MSKAFKLSLNITTITLAVIFLIVDSDHGIWRIATIFILLVSVYQAVKAIGVSDE